jgi:hypothetical protein
MPDVSTEVAIATTTLSSTATSITFSSIPSTYTDLRLVVVGVASSGVAMCLRFNSDSGSNYSQTYLYGDGSTAASGRNTSLTRVNLTQVTNFGQNALPQLVTADIFSYASSTYKTFLNTEAADQNGGGFASTVSQVSLWRSTSAIDNIYLYNDGSGNYAAGTTATLYGIL